MTAAILMTAFMSIPEPSLMPKPMSAKGFSVRAGANRRGRPRKFSRPSRAITLTLPEDTIAALRAVDRDLSRAVVRVVQPLEQDAAAFAGRARGIRQPSGDRRLPEPDADRTHGGRAGAAGRRPRAARLRREADCLAVRAAAAGCPGRPDARRGRPRNLHRLDQNPGRHAAQRARASWVSATSSCSRDSTETPRRNRPRRSRRCGSRPASRSAGSARRTAGRRRDPAVALRRRR